MPHARECRESSQSTRLSELTDRVAEIDGELREPLSADFEERATDLENQEAPEAIENFEMREIREIQESLTSGFPRKSNE
jgi:hypothetical protein